MIQYFQLKFYLELRVSDTVVIRMVLASIILVCLTANLCLAANVANTQQRVPPATPVPQIPAIDKTTQVPPPDADYWDNDDFVPFQSNRHDEFDWRLTKALMLSDPSNMILSPFSVKLLLSLLSEAAGPDTSTHKELAAVLPSIQTIIQARELYGKIFGSLLEKSPNYELQIGTKIYVDKSINPRQRYAAIMESYYFTKVEKIEFSKADEAAKTINDWCANITQNHIKELVKKDDVEESVIIMLNALYFNGYWRRPFPVNETVQQPFYVTPTQQVKTWFMGVTDTFYYMESQPLNAKILRLPYKGRKFSMTIILPNAKGGLDEMIRQLESSSLHRAQWLMSEVEVRVEIPKFKFDFTSKLNDILQDIGIKSIFTNEASLPALARGADVAGRLQVSKILQKAGIYANEQGSTVYVATEVSIVNRFGGETTREFIANRPFIFIIEDETTGTLLFAGKVTDPTKFTT